MESIARRAQPRWFEHVWIWLGVPVVACGLFVGVGFGCVMLKEASSAWNSPATEDGVARLRSGSDALMYAPREPAAPLTASHADFDGDGVLDRLEVRGYHVEAPFVARSTSGMVLVTSGATGEVLLGYAVPTPFHDAGWCGDVDANGTQDVFVGDDVPRVFGWASP